MRDKERGRKQAATLLKLQRTLSHIRIADRMLEDLLKDVFAHPGLCFKLTRRGNLSTVRLGHA